MPKNNAYFYVFLSILLWSSVPAVAKFALGELSNLQMFFYTNFIGVVSLSLVILLLNKASYLSKYTVNDYGKMFLMGSLGVYLYYIFLYSAFALAPAGQANMINYLWPTFIVVFSIPILKEKFNNITILAILTSFAGALIVFSKGSISNFDLQHSTGYLLALGAAICYGLFSVLGKKLNYEKFTSTWVYYISSFVLIVPTVLLFSNLVVPASVNTILALVFLGGFANSLGFVFWFKALEQGETHKIANIIYLNPFISLIFVYLINSESIPLISLLGLVLIVAGIFVQLKNKVKKQV